MLGTTVLHCFNIVRDFDQLARGDIGIGEGTALDSFNPDLRFFGDELREALLEVINLLERSLSLWSLRKELRGFQQVQKQSRQFP
jgi:hypothetical protein